MPGRLNSNPFTDVEGVSGETRHLSIITAPGDVSFKLGKLPVTFYWDFAYNTEGKGRTEDIYGLKHDTKDDFAYLVGLELGENKTAGDWAIEANWRQTGLAAVDPNLNDSDFALGELNMRGFEVAAAYNLTDYW